MTHASNTTTPTISAADLAAALQPDVPRGFILPCLRCGEEGTVKIDLADLTGEESITCTACDQSYGVPAVLDVVRRWTPCLAWLAAAPTLPSDEGE